MVAVLFDLEGTLVDVSFFKDAGVVQEFRQSTREKLIKLGIPPQALGEIKTYSLMRNKAIEYAEANFSREKASRFYQRLDEFLEKYEMSSAKSSELFSDTIPTLSRVKALGYKLGLITNTSKKATEYMFSQHGLKKFFDVVVTREDVRRFKPEPEGIQLALRKLGEKGFILVGDLRYDASAAEKAGGISIILNRNRSKKLDFHADYRVNSLEEILSIMQTISKIKQK